MEIRKRKYSMYFLNTNGNRNEKNSFDNTTKSHLVFSMGLFKGV